MNRVCLCWLFTGSIIPLLSQENATRSRLLQQRKKKNVRLLLRPQTLHCVGWWLQITKRLTANRAWHNLLKRRKNKMVSFGWWWKKPHDYFHYHRSLPWLWLYRLCSTTALRQHVMAEFLIRGAHYHNESVRKRALSFPRELCIASSRTLFGLLSESRLRRRFAFSWSTYKVPNYFSYQKNSSREMERWMIHLV